MLQKKLSVRAAFLLKGKYPTEDLKNRFLFQPDMLFNLAAIAGNQSLPGNQKLPHSYFSST